MTILELVVLLFVAGIIGGIAQSISGYSHGGCLSGIAVGFVGALLGTWIARSFGLPEIFMLNIGGVAMPIVWSIIGATLFVAVVSMLAGPRRRTA
ncbi:MAG: GlsB/YeaQ/YmgE family stress response membrane protein [Planctomycetota bacterium]